MLWRCQGTITYPSMAKVTSVGLVPGYPGTTYLPTYPKKTKTARFGNRVGTPEYSRVYALAVPGYYYLPRV